MQKTFIFGYFGPKRPILDHFWPKRGHFRIFGEKAKTSLFYSFFHFSMQKNQKILMRVRTNGGESKDPLTPSRDQKKVWVIIWPESIQMPMWIPFVKSLRHIFGQKRSNLCMAKGHKLQLPLY